MITNDQLRPILRQWAGLLGAEPTIGGEHTGRELWPVVAEDATRYFLKRIGPWRNLPLADQARVLRWLSRRVSVAEFMITDDARLFAGELDDSFVLIERLAADQLGPSRVLPIEETIGAAIAQLHKALASYPWPVDSYRERLSEAMGGTLHLPADLAAGFAERRDGIAEAIAALPVQLVHGDLTPDNILLHDAGVSGFIDFDHLPLAPRAWDIAKYLSRRMRLRWRNGATYGRLDHIGPLVRGYHRQNPLSPAEVGALPGLITAGNIGEASYSQAVASGILQRRMLPDHHDALADTLEAARWTLENFEAVEAAVRGAIEG